MTTRRLAVFFDFRNNGFFPAVGGMVRFAVTCIAYEAQDSLSLSFLNSNVSDVSSRLITLSADDILRVNPNTGTLPLLADQRDADILTAVYRRFPVVRRDGDQNGNPWDVNPGAMSNMTSDAGQFVDLADLAGTEHDDHVRVSEGDRYLPLYEGKHFWLYEHRYATSAGAADPNKPRSLTGAEHSDPRLEIEPRYWVKEAAVRKWYRDEWDAASWEIAFRLIARASDSRTMILSVMPRGASGNGAPVLRLTAPWKAMALIGVWSSIPFDFVVRQKMSGANVNLFILDQLATPTPQDVAEPIIFAENMTWADWLHPRVLELTYTSHSLSGWAHDLGYDGPPFAWDPERRRHLQAEIDAAMFHLYGHNRRTTEYILDSFATLRRAEERECGEFVTRRLVLAEYDDMSSRIAR